MTQSFLLNEDDTFISLERQTGWFILLEDDNVADQIEIQLPKTRYTERSAFTATVYFRDRAAKEGSLPTTARYRIDDLEAEQEVRGWTTLTPANSIAIAITASEENRVEVNAGMAQGNQPSETTRGGDAGAAAAQPEHPETALQAGRPSVRGRLRLSHRIVRESGGRWLHSLLCSKRLKRKF